MTVQLIIKERRKDRFGGRGSTEFDCEYVEFEVPMGHLGDLWYYLSLKRQLHLFLTGIMIIKNNKDIGQISNSVFPIHRFKELRILQSLDKTSFSTPCRKIKNLDFLNKIFFLITTVLQQATAGIYQFLYIIT